ncbi:MAG: sensor histidine kinase [Bacillota bacterium]
MLKGWQQSLIRRFRRTPIRQKMWLGFFVTSLVPLLVLGLFGLIQTDQELKRLNATRMEQEVAVRASRVSAKLVTHRQTLAYLASLPALQQLLAATTEEQLIMARRQVEADFIAMSAAAQVYYQIRFLDEQGREQIRVDHREGPVLVPAGSLQDKRDRQYFREASRLPWGAVYVSPVELNQEFGQIEVPHMPVLRLATPVADSGGRHRGLVILNIDANSFLEDPIENEQGAELLIIKKDGSYVSHPDPAKRFGGPSDLNTGHGIQRDYPEIADLLLTYPGGVTTARDGRTVAFIRLAPTADAHAFLILVMTRRAGVMAGLANPMWWTAVAIIIGVALLSRWAGLAVARQIVGPIETLRDGVAALRLGHLGTRVVTDSEDEIAQLGDDVNHMAAELEEMYSRLEEKVEQRTRTLAEMHRQLQESDRHKSQFLATTSHELRTPLTAVIGFAEELEDESAGPLQPLQKRYVANILSSARHLLGLINDLLDLSKIEAGRMTLHPTDVDLPPLLDSVVSMVNGMARLEGIALKLEVAEGMAVHADRERLKQVLLNLMANALKFTPHGGSITIVAERVGTEGRIAVVDTGIGIAPENLERIFREFEQVDSSLTRRREGTGLGLPLSKRLVELMGGRIGVESRPGEGSCFWITLPLKEESECLESWSSTTTRSPSNC